MDTAGAFNQQNGDAELELVCVHEAAGLALVRTARDGSTKWISWPPPPPSPSVSGHLRQPSIALKKKDFARNAHFQVITSADGHPPQNVLILLHGRGDREEPFAKLGVQMALPQTGESMCSFLHMIAVHIVNDTIAMDGQLTAVCVGTYLFSAFSYNSAAISLRAPLELPFDLGNTWYEDLDDDFEVIPPHVPHAKRSQSLDTAVQFVWTFMQTLHAKYGWKYERMFLFGFSQGACVAYHVLMALAASPSEQVRLGGVVLIAGGLVAGSHSSQYAQAPPSNAETPVLAICGAKDTVYPASLSNQSELLFAQRYRKAKALFTKYVVQSKGHEMIRSQDEIRQVMTFFAATLFLKNIELERRSDLIEIIQ